MHVADHSVGKERREASLGVVLVGGRSSRMGRSKTAVRIPSGERMFDVVCRSLSGAVREVVLSGGRDEHEAGSIVRCIADDQPGEGPLAAIATVLHCVSRESNPPIWLIVCPCDMPALTTSLFHRLLNAGSHSVAVFAWADGTPSPLPMRLRADASTAQRIEQMLAEGSRSLRTLLTSEGVDIIPLTEAESHALRNINTPEDLAAFDEGEHSFRAVTADSGGLGARPSISTACEHYIAGDGT